MLGCIHDTHHPTFFAPLCKSRSDSENIVYLFSVKKKKFTPIPVFICFCDPPFCVCTVVSTCCPHHSIIQSNNWDSNIFSVYMECYFCDWDQLTSVAFLVQEAAACPGGAAVDRERICPLAWLHPHPLPPPVGQTRHPPGPQGQAGHHLW